jgi:small subunit ribosomal protein S23
MAGSRLEKFGTIFTRTKGLLVSGAVKEHDRPLWFDVYEAFPPRYEPRQYRPVQVKEIKSIFYPEDAIRAKFYSEFGSPGRINLSTTDHQYKSLGQRFVEKFSEIKSDSNAGTTDEDVFKKTEDQMIAKGVYLREDRERPLRVAHEKKPRRVSPKSELIKGIDLSKIM